MGDETREERQDNEYAALEAIFGEAVVDNREQIAWKVWRPLDLMLTLHPLHNSDVQGVHCSITLHIKCCPNYPDEPPEIIIHKMHGLSTENATKLLDELSKLARQLCGEVMIFELAQHAQQFLHDHNKPTLSFYEEMLKQRNEMEQLKLHDMQVKEDEERKKIKEEIQRREEILKAAGRQRIHRSSASQENSNEELDAPELVYYADNKASPVKMSRSQSVSVACTCNIKTAQVLRVTQRNNKKVYIGNCLGHSSNGSTTYLAIDDETGERLITKKWNLPPAPDFQTRNRQLNSLQQDLKNMCRITNSSLTPYVAMEMSKETTKRTINLSVYIFRDFVLGSSLNYLRTKLKVYKDKCEALQLLRHVALGVFSALKDLHEVSVVHKDVRSENVFLDDGGKVRLVGASLDSRLAEMLDGEDYCDRQNQAQDIYATAQMLLSIVAQGDHAFEIPPDLPSSAKDFLSRCLTDDEHSQWSAAQLVNHGFLVDAPVIQPDSNHKDDAGSRSEDDDAVKKIQGTSLKTNGHSRLNAEFEVLTWLGKGAFGDVLKVKNKLDGGFYAIKRIQLNPENVNLNKKITREVKLLSRLNHENVVRYYNAWIESTSEVDNCPSEERAPTKKRNSLEDIVAKLGQEVKVEWSMSEGIVQKSNSDSEDEGDPWFDRSPEDESSDDIEFEDLSNKSETIPSEDVPDSPRPPSERLKQVLYIQMEFCEKNTLRHAIDNCLFKEHYRAWRLFREIVEGLAHVHQRGMIHRDLKPVNIFLDSNDHVKIGDFGLATKAFSGLPVDEKNKLEEVSGSLTGQIGTALYVAPELLQSASKGIYNQKVDIYSLGIILFEMFHPPLNTGMERMVVLTSLRTKDIVIPKAFETEENAKQIHVIRWLLNHDASIRPTCAELLASSHVPRPVAEGALSGLLSHTLSSRGSRGYQRLISACLQQTPSMAEDITYHNGMRRTAVTWLTTRVAEVFRSHGAVEFSPPLLTPSVRAWDAHPNAVKVMTASGTVCHLPHDLRLPFARHVAYSGTKYMRRYVIDRVFREKHVPGFHPREIIECAFDIFNPKSDTLWPDAELLVVASRAAAASGLKVAIQLNHTDLLKTLLLSCGVPLDKHAEIYPVLVDVSFGRITSLQLQTHLTSLCIPRRDVTSLLQLMEADLAVSEVKDLAARALRSPKGAEAGAAAVRRLEAVWRDARALGCECPMTVAPFLAYNATQHGGVFWQMSVIRDEQKRAKHRAGDLIAAGGRYDPLVEEFRKVSQTKEIDGAKQKGSCVGFSMSLERMAAIVKKMEVDMPQAVKPSESNLICVHVWGTAGNGRDGIAATKRAELARDLWAGGLTACACPPTDEPHAQVVLRHDGTGVNVACYSDRVIEVKVPYIDVIDFVKQKLNPETMRSEGTSNRIAYQGWNDVEKSNSPNISVTYVTSEKMTKNSKRYCENMINTQMTSILSHLGLQPLAACRRAHALALACPAAAVRALCAQLTAPLHAQDVAAAAAAVAVDFPKHQKILEEAQEELINLCKQSNQSRSEEPQLYALYSIPDSLCRLIT